MAHTSRYERRKAALLEHGYRRCRPATFDFSILSNVHTVKRAGQGSNDLYNDVIIMIDTESSKQSNFTVSPSGICERTVAENHICAWTISIRAYHENIVTLYGTRPDEMVQCMDNVVQALPGDQTIMYCHNLAWDYVYLRQFFYAQWGTPKKQLNTKPFYPLFVTFANGLQIRDSLILAQRSLDKWGKDLKVDHYKAVGYWDYDKIRNQSADDVTADIFTPDELTYIENDTLCGVECIDKTMQALGKRVYSIPYTATGIPREEVRIRGKLNHAHELFLKIQNEEWEVQQYNELMYHGGYVHGNRHCIGYRYNAWGLDFVSSYIFALLTMKAPMDKWRPVQNVTLEDILKTSDKYAFMFQLKMVKPRLKNDWIPMPVLQFSKCTNTINAVLDNGRILCGAYAEILTNEIDVITILEQYDFDQLVVDNVYYAPKDYLPKWFTDYVYELFINKCKFKGGDPVLYALAKAKLNSLYGLCVQRPVKIMIKEDYMTGKYKMVDPEEDPDQDPAALYKKWRDSRGSVLPYVWGVYCTSTAMRNLFRLGNCVADGEQWLYSDTDSIYATGWDQKKVDAYNEECKRILKERGYPGVEEKGEVYWLGIAEPDPEMVYTEFITQGAKRYAGRCQADGQIHITVAGVPKKKGALCLNDDMGNFRKGFVFRGEITGKQQHTYFFNTEGIRTDTNGNLIADSIDLSPTDYTLDDVTVTNWQKIFEDEIELQVYEEDFNERR